MTMNIMRELGKLLYPWGYECRCCKEDTFGEHMLCPACLRELREELPVCGFGGGQFYASAAAHRYGDAAKEMVTSLKYSSMYVLADEMARDMLNAAEYAGIECPDIVAYVPMHALRRKIKYFDQAELLARLVADHWHMKDSAALKRVRYSGQQAKLSDYAKRMKNVKDAFSVVGSVEGKRVLLVDDVFTTGATSGECARVLTEAGAYRVDLLVYAMAGKEFSVY